jgi:hypothetical protein
MSSGFPTPRGEETGTRRHLPWAGRGAGGLRDLGLSGIQRLEMGYEGFQVFLGAHKQPHVSLSKTCHGVKSLASFPPLSMSLDQDPVILMHSNMLLLGSEYTEFDIFKNYSELSLKGSFLVGVDVHTTK